MRLAIFHNVTRYAEYYPSKETVHRAAKTFGYECGPPSINVNSKASAVFRTRLIQWININPAGHKTFLGRIPTGRADKQNYFSTLLSFSPQDHRAG
jgi:hypothetical protein